VLYRLNPHLESRSNALIKAGEQKSHQLGRLQESICIRTPCYADEAIEEVAPLLGGSCFSLKKGQCSAYSADAKH
jgi:hypothetical protein